MRGNLGAKWRGGIGVVLVLAGPAYVSAATTNITASADSNVRGQGTYWGVNNNYGTDGLVYFDQINATGTGLDCERGFVGFVVSGIEGQVTNAVLSLFTGNVGKTFTAHRVTRQDWTELGVTWINANKLSVPVTAWNTAGGDYDASKSATQGPSGTGEGRKVIDVTGLLQDALAAGHAFAGFMLTCPEGGASFWSKENTGYKAAERRPTLIVLTKPAVSRVSGGTVLQVM